jgi:outer membrane protein OmpA-like peptidoglycan-associated protein
MEGNIRFFPDPNGPYSAQIGLVQVVNTTDVGGRTTSKPGKPLDWTKVGGGESGRMDLMTTGTDGAEEGWFVDSSTATNARGSSVGPNYIEHFISPAPDNQFGWLRSPTDWRETSLWDYPTSPIDLDFEFETVAKATDTQTVYGALEWGFGIRSGVVQNEYAQAYDAESAVFNEALERFRGYYTHEPIVIYFDTGQDIPLTGEEDKISGVMDYLNRYPDVMVQIEGFADERGRPGMNADLSMRRALNVQNLMMLHGLDGSRVDYAIGWGETQTFAAGRDEGTWRANRRVVVSFQRTASTPIVMP